MSEAILAKYMEAVRNYVPMQLKDGSEQVTAHMPPLETYQKGFNLLYGGGYSEDAIRGEAALALSEIRRLEARAGAQKTLDLLQQTDVLNELCDSAVSMIFNKPFMAYVRLADEDQRERKRVDKIKEAPYEWFPFMRNHVANTFYESLISHAQEGEQAFLRERLFGWALTGKDAKRKPSYAIRITPDFRFVEYPTSFSQLHGLYYSYALDLALLFYDSLDLPNKTLSDLKEILGLSKGGVVKVTGGGEAKTKGRRTIPPLPPSPDPFTRPLVPFASNFVVHGGFKAFFQAPTGWPEDEFGIPRYVHRVDGKQMRGTVSYHIVLPSDASDEAFAVAQKELAHNMLKEMGPDTAWLHMLLLAYSAQTYKGGSFVIPREEVYRVLGLDKRTDLTRSQKDERCFNEMDRLRSIGIQIVSLELGGKNIDFQRGISSLWDLGYREYGQARLIPESVGKWTLNFNDWQLTGRPGLAWADIFLYGDGPRQFGNMAREMLRTIDRRKAPLGPGLAVQLVFQSRFEAGEVIRVRNRNIIEFAGGDLAPEDFRARYDTKTQVMNAIYEQTKWGWGLDFSEWPNDLRPDLAADHADSMMTGDGSEAAPSAWPAGYWDSFLNATTRFVTPAPMLEANLKAKKQLPAPALSTQPAPYTAADFKEARQRLRWTQRETAHYLGISQQMVSFFENGKREITSVHKRKMEQALRTPK